MAVTTYDIARIAKTTQATVSRALRDDPTISRPTQKRIRKLADELGYRPNLLARSLTEGKTYTIGFLMSSYQLEAASNKVVVLDQLVSKSGYKVFVSYTKGELNKTIESANDLMDRGVDGLLIYGSYYHLPTEKIEKALQFKVPTVFFDIDLKFPCRQIVQDKEAGVMRAVEYLYGLGHKDIHMLFAYWGGWQHGDRFRGFVNVMNKLGFDDAQSRVHLITPPLEVNEGGKEVFGHDDVVANIKKFFRDNPECTAVMCSNDLVAMDVMNTAWEMGLRVPEDISVMGFDNIMASEHTYPSLTTISQPVQSIVSAAWKMLLDGIENETSKPEKVVIPSELMIRESTGRVGR